MSVPNIFEYATKELTQDALICWLVACAKDSSGNYQKRGLEFISTLYNHHHRFPNKKKHNICIVEGPQLQRNYIDVYFRARVNGKTVSFIIEDKVGTSMHSNQLRRNLESVRRDGEEEEEIVPIYYKTEYVFDDEREEAKQQEYSVFESKDILKFLNQSPLSFDHEILRQYREYLQKRMDCRDNQIKVWDFENDFVQWKFFKDLQDRLEGCRDNWEVFVEEPLRDGSADEMWQKLLRGSNRGGSPWTQYWFSKHLFWRLDPKYPLRLMVWTEAASRAGNGFDFNIWSNWIDQFKELSSQYGLTVDEFTKRMRYRGNEMVNEGTVGLIDVKEMLKEVSMKECQKRIAKFHIAFMRSLHEMGE